MKQSLVPRFWTRVWPSLILFTAFLAACSAGTSTVAPAQPEVTEATAASQPVTTIPAVDTSIPTEQSVVATVVPVATSRGSELQATEPSTVKLASGGLQLVEFFRFT